MGDTSHTLELRIAGKADLSAAQSGIDRLRSSVAAATAGASSSFSRMRASIMSVRGALVGLGVAALARNLVDAYAPAKQAAADLKSEWDKTREAVLATPLGDAIASGLESGRAALAAAGNWLRSHKAEVVAFAATMAAAGSRIKQGFAAVAFGVLTAAKAVVVGISLVDRMLEANKTARAEEGRRQFAAAFPGAAVARHEGAAAPSALADLERTLEAMRTSAAESFEGWGKEIDGHAERIQKRMADRAAQVATAAAATVAGEPKAGGKPGAAKQGPDLGAAFVEGTRAAVDQYVEQMERMAAATERMAARQEAAFEAARDAIMPYAQAIGSALFDAVANLGDPGAAIKNFVKQIVASMRGLWIAKAIENTAAALSAWATGLYPQAAAFGKSAALYGTLAAGATAAGAAMGGGGGGGVGGGAAMGGGSAAAYARGATRPGTTVAEEHYHVHLEGSRPLATQADIEEAVYAANNEALRRRGMRGR